MTSTPHLSLAAASITRRLNRAGAPVLFTRALRKYDTATRLVALVAAEVVCRDDDTARACSAVLLQAGYEVAARKGYGQLVVTLPEPVEETVDEVEALLDEVEARADAEYAADEEQRAVDAGDGLVHLLSDALLDACGTAGPGGLHLAPSTTPERITCPRCLLYAVDEEVQRLGYRNAAHYLDARPELRARVEVAADDPDSTAPIPVDLGEADVPPTVDERVTVRIRASELRPGDEVVDFLGNRQYAAFDVQTATEDAGRTVRVWTAIRDQERGLPPVVVMRAERELLAALDRV